MGTNSQGRQGLEKNNRNDVRRTHASNQYVQGNAAKQLDVVTAIQEKEVRKLSTSARKNREKAFHMSFGYVLFLSLALLLSSYVLIGYIELQASITSTKKVIAELEVEYHNLKVKNDEEYSRINSLVDLDEVKRIAITELGMKYATEEQIVFYDSNESDYVVQLRDIKK